MGYGEEIQIGKVETSWTSVRRWKIDTKTDFVYLPAVVRAGREINPDNSRKSDWSMQKRESQAPLGAIIRCAECLCEFYGVNMLLGLEDFQRPTGECYI